MRVRYFEGRLAHLLAAQRCVSIVARFTEGGPKPVGLAIDPAPPGGVSVVVQMVGAAPTTAATSAADKPETWPGSDAEVEHVAVPRAPESAAEWAEAIAAVVNSAAAAVTADRKVAGPPPPAPGSSSGPGTSPAPTTTTSTATVSWRLTCAA
ncbi:hypothetical protein EV384_5494 [Micromonospora kangleipakensis]|uniref:Uncharacterized protein n=1 Tax=Micromonospora kangleipakensis TaxID=1077942 RepID=A0A4Q8BFQ4_9ACTN|nr:hypothetical protein [Micromonospora kangleipakensis]RZU76804.1 hypothetical protein EV384_5494 [Micromonospora kangleipakensis]